MAASSAYRSISVILKLIGADKHFIESVSTLVTDSLEGICSVNPQLAFDRGNKSKCLRDSKSAQ